MAITYKVSDKSSRFLVPTGESDIDVTKMAWTKTPMSGRKNVPSLYLTEYQQNVGQLISAAIFYTKATAQIINQTDGFISGAESDKSIYQYRYFAEPTGFTYRFPFFSQKKTSKSNQFGYENDQNPFASLLGIKDKYGASNTFSKIDSTAASVQAIISSSLPGEINLENPQSWRSSPEPEISVTFDLFNTGTTEDITNNRNFAYIFAYQNSPSRRSAFIVDPPVIYDMYIPDVISMPACYVSSLEILNLGNTRQIQLYSDGVKRIVPEAYRFNITFKSLLMDTRNIMNGLDTGERLHAVNSLDEYIANNGGEQSLVNIVRDFTNDQNNRPGTRTNPSTESPFR